MSSHNSGHVHHDSCHVIILWQFRVTSFSITSFDCSQSLRIESLIKSFDYNEPNLCLLHFLSNMLLSTWKSFENEHQPYQGPRESEGFSRRQSWLLHCNGRGIPTSIQRNALTTSKNENTNSKQLTKTMW